ncbi:MAG TPA: ATP-binding protein [Acidimicrobiia bacterium]|jgi:anti-sigma regulatory factor (Ser/Thr protein kinase)
MSMTAMLLAEELIDEQEAHSAQQVAAGGGFTSAAWDVQSNAFAGDYFSQERAMIDDQTRTGRLSGDDAAQLRHVLSRIQRATTSPAESVSHQGWLRKRFPNTDLAPALARAALATTAIGIPGDVFDDAVLLTSEMVTNSVRHSQSDWIDVAITLGPDVLRVEVADPGSQSILPRTPDAKGGWGLTLIAALATRWGVNREGTGKSIWVEFDLAFS